MAIPDYQSLMLPILKLVYNKAEWKMSELTESLGKQFNLTEVELKELLPSGLAFIFYNRVAWARTYLKKAGLLDSVKRGTISITEKGINVLKTNPDKINVKFLKQFPEFVEFQNLKKDDSTDETQTSLELVTEETPEETLENSYQNLRKSLAFELRNKVIEMSPAFFEKLVVELLVKMGYGGSIKDAGKAIGKSGDEGIDGTIKEDKLGLDVIYIQAKRWKIDNKVDRPELHKFVGALAGQKAKKGVFITTSEFTNGAIEYTHKTDTKIVLIDGPLLAQLMIDYNLGVNLQATFDIKKIDSDYFIEE
jgi:restriction system protein